MAKSDLLAEAIADAKRVKSTALANAKIALEEAFQPTLQRMISTKLAEEEGEEDDFDLNIEVEPEMSAEPAAPEAPVEADPVGMGSFEDGGEEEAPVEEPEEDMELESFLRELEAGEGEEEDLFAEGGEEDWNDPIQEEDEFGMEDDDTELTEAEVNALSSLFEEEGLGDIDGSEDEDGGSFELRAPSSNLNMESRRLRKENAKLKSELTEAYKVVTTMKKVVNDVNLLNAKLMFTTKALRIPNLTENQRIRIMQQIDRAANVREVKLVYTSVCESILNRKSSTKRSVNEGYASKPMSVAKKSINESKSSDVIKWQRMAGILPPADY